jgi:hypothetical protein
LRLRPRGGLLLTAALMSASLTLIAGPGLAADCRSNTECIPPVTTADIAGVAGENGWWRSDVVVTLACSDAGSGCGSTSYSLDGSSYNTYNGPFPVAGEGLHFIEAGSVDAAGNKESPELIVVRIDATTPGVAILRPVAGDLYVINVGDPLPVALPVTIAVDETTVEAGLDDALSGPGRIELYVDGALRGGSTAPFSVLWEAGEESLGPHTVTVVGYDTAGNSASASLEVITLPTTQAGAEATANAAAAMVPGV